MIANADDFLEACGATNNGFLLDSTVPYYIEKILECGEIGNDFDKLIKLDSLLPMHMDGTPHPTYFITLMWLESMGLIEREACDGGLQLFSLTDAGIMILQFLRDKREGYN